jgi:hypothetical protein
MVYLTSTLHLLALALIANVARATPDPLDDCEPTWGPFYLFTATPGSVTLLRVVDNGVDANGNIISTLSVSATFIFTHSLSFSDISAIDVRQMR